MSKIRRYERPKLIDMSGRVVVSWGDCWDGNSNAGKCHYGDWATGTDCYYGHWNTAGNCHQGFFAGCPASTQCTGGSTPNDCKSGNAAVLDCLSGAAAPGDACCYYGYSPGSCSAGTSK